MTRYRNALVICRITTVALIVLTLVLLVLWLGLLRQEMALAGDRGRTLAESVDTAFQKYTEFLVDAGIPGSPEFVRRTSERLEELFGHFEEQLMYVACTTSNASTGELLSSFASDLPETGESLGDLSEILSLYQGAAAVRRMSQHSRGASGLPTRFLHHSGFSLRSVTSTQGVGLTVRLQYGYLPQLPGSVGMARRSAITAFVLFVLSASLWTFLDARSRGLAGTWWALLVLVGNLLGVLLYLLSRPQSLVCECPACHRVVRETFAFCPYCKTPIGMLCMSCGLPLQTDWNYCPKCQTEAGSTVSAGRTPST